MSSRPPPDVFLASAEAPKIQGGLSDLSLQDIHEIRLLLRGDSVVDWHRLGIDDIDGVRRLLNVNGIDIDRPSDRRRLEALRAESVHYIRDTLGLKLDEDIATGTDVIELPLIASSRGKLQRHACTLLKVMHIIYHLDARELRMALPIPDSDFFRLVEQSVATLFDELRRAGVPVEEFSWSKKTKDSLITKLLVKRETSAARVFDRLRFRLVVRHEDDLLPTLHVILQQFIPFNYVVPDQTVNTLIDLSSIERSLTRTRDFSVVSPPEIHPNEFSGSDYRILNFVADLPVRVDKLPNMPFDAAALASNVVFVLAEFQIIDRHRAELNEQGDNSHAQYKLRQHQRVRERLLRDDRKS